MKWTASGRPVLSAHVYGVRGIAYNLLESYLNNRSQIDKINEIKSASTNMNIGVHQGTILGALWFLKFINDLSYFYKYLRRTIDLFLK